MKEAEKISTRKEVTLYTVIAFLSFAYLYSRYMQGMDLHGLSAGLSLYVSYSFWLHYLVLVSLAGVAVLVFEGLLGKRSKVWMPVTAIAGSLLTVYLYVDSKLYNTINLHVNGFVIESLLQENALEQVGITPQQLFLWTWPVVLFLLVHVFISPLSKYRIASIPFSWRKIALFLTVLVALVGVDKLLYSYFYYKGKPFVFQLKETPPAYVVPHSYYINGLFGLILGDEPKVSFTEPLDNLQNVAETGSLNYKASVPASEAVLRHRFNIVMVVAESLRKHDVDPETAPFYMRLSQDTIEAGNHYSSGNTTHFGLFSLFYGLNPYYFNDFRLSLIPPAGLTLLEDHGYEIYATAARTMRWYDQDKFLLGHNPEIYIPETGRNFERDSMVTDRSIEIARQHQESGEPYLNFIYYYTTHADYEHPDSHSIFLPEIKGKVDFSDQALRGEKRQELVNRYRNAIHYVDSELKRLVDGIKEAGAWNNTILVFTGDHGEEFFEENTFGHNSNLNEYQTRVPFLMHIPGRDNIDIGKQTSHMDVMQTILGEIFKAAVEDIQFQGRNMLSEENGAVYVAKAHYQKPTAYAIHVKGQKAIVNIEGGFMEIESIAGENGEIGSMNRILHSGIAGLVQQIKELRN